MDSTSDSKAALQWTLLHAKPETTDQYLDSKGKAIREVFEKTHFGWQAVER